jgi:iron complex transport system substrate-binding protein
MSGAGVRPQRIASLVPSATEIVYALGLDDALVAVTFECNYPGDPRQGRAIVVGGLDTAGLDSAGIDAVVRERTAAGQLLYTLDRDRFARCDPDLVLTQDLCRICALPAGQLDQAMAELGCRAEVVVLDPQDLRAVLDSIIEVGAATSTRTRAEELVADLEARMDAVAARVAGRPRPRVLVLEWPDPPFVAGHWVPELVERAGGEAVLGRPGQRSVPVELSQVRTCQADIVVVASCGFGVDASAEHAQAVAAHVDPRAQVWALDADGLVVRPGPRLVDGIEVLAGIFHGVAVPDATQARRVR